MSDLLLKIISLLKKYDQDVESDGAKMLGTPARLESK